MSRRILVYTTLIFLTVSRLSAQSFTLYGTVKSMKDSSPVPFATIVLGDNQLWTISADDGTFTVNNVPSDNMNIAVQCLGYVKRELVVSKDMNPLTIFLKEDNLEIQEVTVTAKKSASEVSTAYTLDRKALDHQQILNVSDINSLLPGGKTVNSNLTTDNRTALRSGTSELGNASFATAIQADGARISNNADLDETAGASTRNISASNIESVEIITGIPSVEYGDLSNGIVIINTKKGKTPFVLDLSTNPHTKQAAVSKGFELKDHGGTLNTSFEHTKSFTDIASPHTSYARNVLDLKYSKTFNRLTDNPLMLTFAASGNTGGYDSKADPDAFSDNYTKKKDYVVRLNANMAWLLNKSWITNLNASLSMSAANKTTETNTNRNSASTQPYVHTTTEGYFIAQDYDTAPDSPIILSPTGYWYVKEFTESKPIAFNAKIKGDLVKKLGTLTDKIMAGAEFSSDKNLGIGTYYDQMRYAPDGYREYRYKDLPAMNNMALYAENKMTAPMATNAKGSEIQLTLGLREDLTMISGSGYGTVSSLSPRGNLKYIFWKDRSKAVSELNAYAGYGKSVKLPSFQVLYPRESYYDEQVFASTSTADGKAFYAYYTHPFAAARNKDLKWQYTNQCEIGAEVVVKGIKISLSGYYNKTFRSYISVYNYTPFTYHKTYASELENVATPSQNRQYSIDQSTGIVSVNDITGANPPVALTTTEKNTYKSNTTFINANPIHRYGIDWTVDFPQIRRLKTTVRLDGNFYRYKGSNTTLLAYWPNSTTNAADGSPFNLIGYYAGSSNTSTSLGATNSYYNGTLKKQLNQNLTFTTHIPKIRMIISLRVEATLYRFSKLLIDNGGHGTLAYASSEQGALTGRPYDEKMRDFYVTVYPVYYSTWDNPTELIPFAERFLWAKDNDQNLYADLAKLTTSTNYGYTLNPDKISAYYSANISVTKEIGDRASLSFYANNFFCHNGEVKSSRTGLRSSLYDSGYIPDFYYGMTLRIKI